MNKTETVVFKSQTVNVYSSSLDFFSSILLYNCYLVSDMLPKRDFIL